MGQSMQIKFDGQENSIDANTLINVLVHYNTIISEANKEYGSSSRSIILKVNAIEKGSFSINLGLKEASSLFSKDTINYIAAIGEYLEFINF
jgi:hypothetical protein